MLLLHVSAHQERHPQEAQCNPHETVCMLCHECGIGESSVWIPSACCHLKDLSASLLTDNIKKVTTLCFHLFHIHDIAYIQFHEDYIGLPEDSAPDAPKHAGAR
jgi:hypothetical protein